MQHPRWTSVPLALLMTLVASQAIAQDMWRSHGWDCDETAFREATPSLDVVARCVRLWEAYRDIATVGEAERTRVVRVMERLYLEGTDRDAHLARHALNRLGVSSLPSRKDALLREERRRHLATRGGPAAGGDPADPEASPSPGVARCAVPAPSRSEQVSAKRAVTAGRRAIKRKKYKDASGILQSAVDAAPGHASARYYAAVAYAQLEDEARMTEHLECLVAIGSDESARFLRRARQDKSFESIRDESAGFKHATGYARIKLGNSLGDYGEDNVDNIESSLERLGWPVEEVTDAPRTYQEPHVWFRPESKRTAYFVMKVIGHPRTKTHVIDWDDEPFDVIVAWGDSIRKGSEPRLYVKDPDDAPKRLDDLAAAENAALRKPEEFVNEVDQVVGTPERAARRVQGSVDRAGRTMDRLEKTGDKLERLFK